jgi:UDP-N-acetylmuramoyl-tripeptide--D-alanyl-D-alanine ligase
VVIPIPVEELARALGTEAHRDLVVTGVAVHSAEVRPGDCFVALQGRRVDGARFVAEALERGAVCAIAGPAAAADPRVFRVADPRAGLAALAALVRSRHSGPVVGITGTVGKTTVKEFLAAILRAAGRRVVAAPASFNNVEGVSRTLVRLEVDTEFLVVELGTSAPGEIRALCALARPTMAVLTAVGPGHLEGLSSVDRVLDEKTDLLRALPPGALAVVNADDPVLAQAALPGPGRILRAGLAQGPRVRAPLAIREAELEAPDGTRLGHGLRGETLVRNLWLAAVTAEGLGLRFSEMAAGIRTLECPRWRGERRQRGAALLILDLYNANPLSMAAALSGLAEEPGPRRAILGTMRELGAESQRHHRELGERLARMGLESVVFVGAGGEAVSAGFAGAGGDPRRLWLVPDAQAARPNLAAFCSSPGVVLLKASRDVGLEALLEDSRA